MRTLRTLPGKAYLIDFLSFWNFGTIHEKSLRWLLVPVREQSVERLSGIGQALFQSGRFKTISLNLRE
jgi:hypothetical protein